MTHVGKSQVVELPDRKAITLCEAVTAFVYGKSYDLRQFSQDRSDEATIKKHAAKLNDLLNGCTAPPMLGASNFVQYQRARIPRTDPRTLTPFISTQSRSSIGLKM